MATLTAQPREKATKTETGRLRKSGVLPLALIRKTNETQLIQATNIDLKVVMHGKGGLIMFDLEHGSEKMKVVVKDVQRNSVTRRVEHITVQEILDTDIFKVPIPIRVVGEPPSVTKRSSTLMVPMMELTVQAEVKSLPDGIVVDVSRMRQNDKITVGDMTWGSGVTPISSPGTVLAATKQLRGMAEFDDDAAFAVMDKSDGKPETAPAGQAVEAEVASSEADVKAE